MNLLHYFELLGGMTAKEIQARYKNTFFGFLWIFINPLMQMTVIGFIFKYFIKSPTDNYYLFLFVGLLIWNFFSLTFAKATASIVNERSLIKKAKFPRSIIPLSIVLANFINVLLVFTILTIGLEIAYSIQWQFTAWFFFAVTLLVIYTSGISLLTSALDVKYRDVNFFVQALLIIWFYATPVVYSISILPKEFELLWGINPLTSAVEICRAFFIGTPIPPLNLIILNFLGAVVIFTIGSLVFNFESKNFDDWL